MIAPVWLIGFSGHRSLTQPQLAADAIKQALESLQQRAQACGGSLEFYSSAAYGADTLAAETAGKLGIPVHLILPMPEEQFREDFFNKNKSFRRMDWRRARSLIADARDGRNGGTLRLARGTHLRPECYYDASMQVLEACDAMLVVWDGKPAKGLGGTADVVEQARFSNKPLLIVSPDSGELTTERLDDFGSANDPEMKLIQKIGNLTRRHQKQGKTPGENLFLSLDSAADDTSMAFRASLLLSIKFHGLATMIAAFAVILPKDQPWSDWTLFAFCAIEMLLVTWALFLSRIHKWRHTHDQWLTTRFGAELVRGMRSATAFVDPLTPQILRHAPSWRRFSLAAGLAASREINRDKGWKALRDDYVNDRLAKQQEHFLEKQAKAAATVHLTQRIGNWATWLAPAFVFIALGYKLFHALHGPPGPEVFSISGLGKDAIVRFMPIFVPLVAGIASGLRTALDSTRRTHRYAEMAGHLKKASTALLAIKTESSARRRIVATEEVLLDELIEWKLAEEQNGGH